jgi:hypothetical protein
MTTRAVTPLDGRTVAVLALGAAVAVALGVYGNVHDATGRSLVTLFFSATINLKVWFGTLALALAGFQLWSALRIYGRVGSGDVPEWANRAHRISGTAAFWISIPVAYHCLWALGFTADAGFRVLAHSILGCFFYGAFVAKVVSVRRTDLAGWVLPVLGGTVFSTLVLIWFTSSFWFFTSVEFPGF